MSRITKKEIEKIFRTSGSPDELFDTFRIAIDRKINDAMLYRILLWNKVLSEDEIMMFAEKICKEFPPLCYQIYFWVGKIFSSVSAYGEYYERAFEYYRKASRSKPESHKPFVAVASLYNHELNIPGLNKIILLLESGLESAEKKSKICFAMSKLYKKTGDKESEMAYQKLGEKYQREGK
jgi:hypothetical protein